MSGQQITISADAFGQFNVKELNEGDFWLWVGPNTPSATPTAIRDTRCHIILFYEPESLDPALYDIWRRLAQAIAGPVVAAVNTSARREIMNAFSAVGADLDNPLNAYVISGVPTILVYRSRWPQAYYNGELSYDALKKWVITLACRPGYREPDSSFTGVKAVVPDQYVTETRIQDFAYPTSSRDYTAFTGQNTRGGGGAEEEGGEEEAGEEEEGGGEEEAEEAQPAEQTQDLGYLSEKNL